jgi:hypothetical protein
MFSEQDEDVPVATAAAALAFGHHRGSSSGSNTIMGGTSTGPSSPKRRPGQASASLIRSMKVHAHAGTHRSSIRSTQYSPSIRRNSSIFTKDLIMSIDNHNASSRRSGGDLTRGQQSMLDSSTTISSHFGDSKSALSSTYWNSHGGMIMVDFSFSQVLHELADGFGDSDVGNDADAEEDIWQVQVVVAARV